MTLDEYAAVYDPQVRRILASKFRLVGDDLDEVMATVLVNVWRALERGGWRPDERGPMPWLVRVGRNAAVDWIRRRAIRRRTLVEWPDLDDDRYPDLIDPEPEPVRQAERAELVARVAAAVAALPPTQRETVVCVYYRGLTHVETAAATGSPLGTVKSRLTYAYDRLRPLLADVA